ncbi:hypothetical protein ACIQNG_39010 [Streptomyces sp. NPDC091377]|uniref:hypothetical protein n=1 Tax=Streptomyces sp. NPDC091377 TaxID=3365995 RepID=UPI0038069D87
MTAGQIVTGPEGEEIVLTEIGQTILLDNERVRVWEVALKPQQTQPWHLHHNPYLVLCLESSPCHMDWLNGDPPRYIEETVGGTLFRAPSPVHMLTNDGDRVYRNRLVELKDLGEEALGDLARGQWEIPDPLTELPVVFENEDVRVYDLELGPGKQLDLPADRPAYVLVTLEGHMSRGEDVCYFTPGWLCTLANTGDIRYSGRLIELMFLRQSQ